MSSEEPILPMCRKSNRQGLILVGKIPGEGNDKPTQCSCPENSLTEETGVGYSPVGRKESSTT